MLLAIKLGYLTSILTREFLISNRIVYYWIIDRKYINWIQIIIKFCKMDKKSLI